MTTWCARVACWKVGPNNVKVRTRHVVVQDALRTALIFSTRTSDKWFNFTKNKIHTCRYRAASMFCECLLFRIASQTIVNTVSKSSVVARTCSEWADVTKNGNMWSILLSTMERNQRCSLRAHVNKNNKLCYRWSVWYDFQIKHCRDRLLFFRLIAVLWLAVVYILSNCWEFQHTWCGWCISPASSLLEKIFRRTPQKSLLKWVLIQHGTPNGPQKRTLKFNASNSINILWIWCLRCLSASWALADTPLLSSHKSLS